MIGLQDNKEHLNINRGCLDKDTTKLGLVESLLLRESYLSLGNR